MAEVDAAAGEWRCRCPSDPEFDTSVNPSFFKRCGKCGMKRPKPPEAEPAPVDGWSALVDACPNCGFSTPEYGLKEGYIKRAAPMPSAAEPDIFDAIDASWMAKWEGEPEGWHAYGPRRVTIEEARADIPKRPAPMSLPSSGVTLCDFHEDQVSQCGACEPGDAIALLQRACSQYRKEAAEWETKYNELRSAKK